MTLADKYCPFCDPDIQERTFAQTGNFMAVYNIAPILPGHSLIIPKMHVTSFLDITDNELFEMIKFSKRIIRVLQVTFKTEAFNWTIQEKEEAGQSVEHLHLHILPRKMGDLPENEDWYPKLDEFYSAIIDSATRPRIPDNHMKKIIRNLTDVACQIP